jgi:hypothetical protein
MMEWQPIWTAPLDGTPILVTHNDFSGLFAVRYGKLDYTDHPSEEGWFSLTWDDLETRDLFDFKWWAKCPHGPWDTWNTFDDWVNYKANVLDAKPTHIPTQTDKTS